MGSEHSQIKTLEKLTRSLRTTEPVTLTNGRKARVVRLNNAATTPPLEYVAERVDKFLLNYGTLHRGAGPYANSTYDEVQKALHIIKRFLGLPKSHALHFTNNTSSAVNIFARMLNIPEGKVITTTEDEHTSNNLPWRYNTRTTIIEADTFSDGSLDYDDLERKALRYKGNLSLIAMTGASNLTGYTPDIRKLAEIAHRNGAKLFIDAAQLAPHRQIGMKECGIDALAFSAHKIYAPFGIGVLALPKEMLDQLPKDPGGGSIDMISSKDILWAPPEIRHQTGTWNVTGIIALAASCEAIMHIGWKAINKHERDLVTYTAGKLSAIEGLKLYVPPEKYSEGRIGTFPFNLNGYHHALLAAILGHEYGIETRAGTICNHRLVRRWFNISDDEQKRIEGEIKQGNRLASYGIVRASLGIHNTREDVDLLVAALKKIAEDGPKLGYNPSPKEETYVPIKK